jgi:hypothetical protein
VIINLITWLAVVQLNWHRADRIFPFVPVKAAAGYLAGYGDPEFIDELNTFTLPYVKWWRLSRI